MSDYAADAVLFLPDGPLVGSSAIRSALGGLLAEFAKPGASFEMQRQSVHAAYAYILWTAETADNIYEVATDTFVVWDDRIVAQSFAGKITPKG